MKQSFQAKEILKKAELKKEDFVNEAVYNTVIGNICELLTKTDELENKNYELKSIVFNQEEKIRQLKAILRDAYLEGFENGWERKEGGVSSFGINEDLSDKYINKL